MRVGRRRQVDADRPAALRHEADLRRPDGAHRGDVEAARRRVRQSRAPHRRPARRARARDHDRRRLPLVRHAAAPLPARRRAGPRAVHPQHGDRRVHSRSRDHPRRRAERRRRADAPPCVHHDDPARPAHHGRGQQDGPRRLVTGALRLDRPRPRDTRGWKRRRRSRRRPAVATGAAYGGPWARGPAGDPTVGASGRQRRRRLGEDAVVRRPDAARAPRDDRARLRPEPRRTPFPGAMGDPADVGRASRLPRLRRHRGGRRVEGGRRSGRAALRACARAWRRSRRPTGRSTRPCRPSR